MKPTFGFKDTHIVLSVHVVVQRTLQTKHPVNQIDEEGEKRISPPQQSFLAHMLFSSGISVVSGISQPPQIAFAFGIDGV